MTERFYCAAAAIGTCALRNPRTESIVRTFSSSSSFLYSRPGLAISSISARLVVEQLRGVGKTCRITTSRASPTRSSAHRPLTRPALGRRGHALALYRQMQLTYSPSIVAASVKVLEESATPDMQVTFAPCSFKGGRIDEFEEKRGLADAALLARLSRSRPEPGTEKLDGLPSPQLR
jgi:hypothetical protein